MNNQRLPYISLLWTNERSYKEWDERPLPPLKHFMKDLCIEKLIESLALDDQNKWYIQRLFLKTCTDTDIIEYRLGIMEDFVDHPELRKIFSELKNNIKAVDEACAPKFDDARDIHKAAWFLNASVRYLDMVNDFRNGLQSLKEIIKSRGLNDLLNKLDEVIKSPEFQELSKHTATLKNELYKMNSFSLGLNYTGLKLNSIAIFPASVKGGEEDFCSLSREILKKGSNLCDIPGGELCNIYNNVPFSRLEEVLLSRAEKLYPEFFSKLLAFHVSYGSYPLQHINNLYPEIAFFVTMSGFTANMKRQGFNFCKPHVNDYGNGVISVKGVYDLSLAMQLKEKGTISDPADCIVGNDYCFDNIEKVFILTGPNQGGKTTFTRAVGMAQLLFQAGCFVPANAADMSPVQGVYTHFPEEEVLGVKKGRLGEEAERLAIIMRNAAADSMILLNESFSSTRRVDGCQLGRNILKNMLMLGCKGIFVTHFVELAYDVDEINKEASCRSKLVSMITGVDDDTGEGIAGKRTYRVYKAKPSGYGYSRDIVIQHNLTFNQLIQQLKSRGIIPCNGGDAFEEESQHTL